MLLCPLQILLNSAILQYKKNRQEFLISKKSIIKGFQINIGSYIHVQGQAVQVSTVVDTSTFLGWGLWPKNLNLHVDCLHPIFFGVGTHNFFTK